MDTGAQAIVIATTLLLDDDENTVARESTLSVEMCGAVLAPL